LVLVLAEMVTVVEIAIIETVEEVSIQLMTIEKQVLESPIVYV